MKSINTILHKNQSSIDQIKKHSDVYQDGMIDLLTKNSLDLDTIGDILIKRHSQDLSFLEGNEQFSFLKDRAVYILPEQNLLEKLEKSKKTNTPLTIKFGIDPTGANIHMGHAVPIVMLNRLQRMGHKIAFVIGDFTAKIGDPTGRSIERPPLTNNEIQKNLSTYKEQVSPFFDISKADFFYNGEWLKKKTLEDLVETLSFVNVSKVLQRDDFRKRLEKQKGLSMAELIYPIIMGIDSIELYKQIGCDIELGGKDQFLNMQMCRTLMQNYNQEPEVIISTDLLEGISGGGKKMSKSLNNYIALNDSSSDIFGKIMSIPDDLLEMYYKSLTDISDFEWEKIQEALKNNLNPRDVKKTLAKVLITIIYGKEQATKAELEFDQKFGHKKDYRKLNLPTEKVSNIEVLNNFLIRNIDKSKNEIRRLIHNGAISKIYPDGTSSKLGLEDVDKNFSHIFGSQEIIILKIGKKYLFKIQKL